LARQVQFGDLAGRLARALDLTSGAGALTLEEGVLPVVIVSDATELPFATEPRAGAGYGSVTGAVGQQATIALNLTGSGKFWLKQLVISRATTGLIEVNRSGRLEAAGTFTDKIMLDVSSKSAPAQGSLFLPLTIRQYTTPPVGIGTGIAWAFSLGAGIALVWPVDMLIGQGETIYVKNLDTATLITVNFQGMYYPTGEDQ
jgi:hypothetical protein